MKNVRLIKRMNTSQKRFKDALEANGIDSSRKLHISTTALKELYSEYRYQTFVKESNFPGDYSLLTLKQQSSVKKSRGIMKQKASEQYLNDLKEAYPVVQWARYSEGASTLIWDSNRSEIVSTIKYL